LIRYKGLGPLVSRYSNQILEDSPKVADGAKRAQRATAKLS